jgi:hypothetical protein
MDCVCAVQRVNGQHKRCKCLWTGYVIRCQAYQFDCQTLQHCWVFHAQQFPLCINNGPPPKGHPANLTQLWEALESTWASIPAERFRHLVESMLRRIEAVLRVKGGGATQYEEVVPNVWYTLYSTHTTWQTDTKRILLAQQVWLAWEWAMPNQKTSTACLYYHEFCGSWDKTMTFIFMST